MILATDYDGTLSRGGVSAEDREAIARFRGAGHLYGVVTGRDFPGAFNSLTGRDNVSFDFIIVMNGAMAVDSRGDILFQHDVDGEILPELIHAVGELCGYPLGCATGKTRREFDPRCPEGREGFAPHPKAGEIPTFTMANTRCSSDEKAARAVEELQKRFGTLLNPLQNGICIDIPAAGIDKGTGVAAYAALMGIPEEEIWTAGDNYNDLAMLTRFRGCAMANGVDAVKKAAKGIYPDIASIIREIPEPGRSGLAR